MRREDRGLRIELSAYLYPLSLSLSSSILYPLFSILSNMMNKTLTCLLLCCCAVLVAGCTNPDEVGRKNITGTVTLDGVPLEKGTIEFAPVDTKAPANASVVGGNVSIKEGKYELKRDMGLYAGTYKVRITHSIFVEIKTGKPLEDPLLFDEDPYAYKAESLIPEKYNTKTELEITVGEDKDQTHDFALTK